MVPVRGRLAKVAQRSDGRVVESSMVSIGDGCYRRMPTCRGFSYVDMVIVVAVLGIVGALLAGAFGLGSDHKQAEWDRDKAQRAAAALEQQHDIAGAINLDAPRLAVAAQQAAGNDAKWEEAERERRRNNVALGACPDAGQTAGQSTPAAEVGGKPAAEGARPAGVADGAGGVRVHWRFVGMHDGAFTGTDGRPVFADSAGYAGDPARADTASPYGLADVLEVNAANARALSACRREFFALRGRIEAAGAAIEKGER